MAKNGLFLCEGDIWVKSCKNKGEEHFSKVQRPWRVSMLFGSRNSKEVNVSGVSKIEVGGCCRLPPLKADAETKSHHNNFYWHLDSHNLKVTRWRELANKYFWKNVLLNYKKHNSDQNNNFINVIKAILLSSSFWFLYL